MEEKLLISSINIIIIIFTLILEASTVLNAETFKFSSGDIYRFSDGSLVPGREKMTKILLALYPA